MSRAGVPVRNIYNDATANHLPDRFRNNLALAGDLVEAFFEFGGYGIVDATEREIARQTNEALASGQYTQVLLVGHSQGGGKVSGAFSGIRPKYRSSVSAITFGSAHTKPLYAATAHVDVHRERDFVSNHAGMRLLRNLAKPITNGLGLTNSRNVVIPFGNATDFYNFGTFGIPGGKTFQLRVTNAHGYPLRDNDTGAPIGYNSIIPQQIQILVNPSTTNTD
jgi:hypothetical protein